MLSPSSKSQCVVSSCKPTSVRTFLLRASAFVKCPIAESLSSDFDLQPKSLVRHLIALSSFTALLSVTHYSN